MNELKKNEYELFVKGSLISGVGPNGSKRAFGGFNPKGRPNGKLEILFFKKKKRKKFKI